MKKTSNLINTLCEIGIFAALGFVFDELQGILFKGIFPNGGSIGFAMIAVIIIAYRRGLLAGLLTGLIMGLLDIATSAYIIHPVQLLLDYILPYALVGFAGLFKPLFDKAKGKTNHILILILGTLIGGLLKLTSHYLAGVFFWSDPSGFAWDLNSMNVYLYCFIYNIAFIGPSIILTSALLVPLYLKAPQVFAVNNREIKEVSKEETPKENRTNSFAMVLSIALMAFGTFVFIFYLIKYIVSFSDYTYAGAYKYKFNPDSMLIFVLGLFLVILGIISLIKYLENKFSFTMTSGVLLTIVFASLIYDIARLIRMYCEEKDPTLYWIWFVIGLLTLLGATAFFITCYIKEKKNK